MYLMIIWNNSSKGGAGTGGFSEAGDAFGEAAGAGRTRGYYIILLMIYFIIRLLILSLSLLLL